MAARDAHQRAGGADAGDEAVEGSADGGQQLWAGSLFVGGDVAGVGELAGQEHRGVGGRQLLGAGDGGFRSAGHELDVPAVAADDQHPLAAHGVGHDGDEREAELGAGHGEGDRRRPARRLDDGGRVGDVAVADRRAEDVGGEAVLRRAARLEELELHPDRAPRRLVLDRDGGRVDDEGVEAGGALGEGGSGRHDGLRVRPYARWHGALRDEDILEPILPKHPPYQRDDEVAEASDAAAVTGVASARPSWDRLVLVGCAVVATLALVVVAMRASSIAEDQRVQTCQIRVYAAEQGGFGSAGRESQRRLTEELAKCVGLDPEVDEETD